ncbi:hypothetical protein TAF16_1381 [Anoxybacillus flavithermus]|uniref:Uncharacterized protein n=1 Tax=Anoxybacillus flavithermus TaxID=33934 RepID=A0A178TES6_9BACL|nr:hypothetical protein TAF16_1381 [Anoxybacillus flavithermus]
MAITPTRNVHSIYGTPVFSLAAYGTKNKNTIVVKIESDVPIQSNLYFGIYDI